MVKKFEKEIGRFIWNRSGKILRVKLDEVKNSPENGGLGLPCLALKSKSLLLSQFLRLLKSEDIKSVSHIGYWMGDLLADFCKWNRCASTCCDYTSLSQSVGRHSGGSSDI